jgi:hypothetical protein
MCVAGACEPGDGPAPLDLGRLVIKRGLAPGTDALTLSASVDPVLAIAPHARDRVAIELRGDTSVHRAGVDHPAAHVHLPGPRRRRRRHHRDRSRPRQDRPLAVRMKVKRLPLADVGVTGGRVRLVIGEECFEADLSGSCRTKGRKLVCGG